MQNKAEKEQDTKPKTPLDVLTKIKQQDPEPKRKTRQPIKISLDFEKEVEQDLEADKEAEQIAKILVKEKKPKQRPKLKIAKEKKQVSETSREVLEKFGKESKPRPAKRKTEKQEIKISGPSFEISSDEIEINTEEPQVQISQSISDTKKLSAQDLLDMQAKELLQSAEGKRDSHNLLKDLKIIVAIMLGKKKNKDLSQALDTDKSFTSKQIRELEEKGLVKRQGFGRDVEYSVDNFNVMKFLQSKVVVKWKKEKKGNGGENGRDESEPEA